MSRTKVTIGICHGKHDFEPLTVRSITATVAWDLRMGSKYLDHDEAIIYCEGTNIASQRNNVARMFLEDTKADWLLFLDSDEGWNPDLIEELVASADPEERPIMSGLIMARRERDMPISPACGLFDDHPTEARIVRPNFVPNVTHWQVATAGTGCLLIHRRVLEAVRDAFSASHPAAIWFDYQPFTYTDKDGTTKTENMGEDYVFSARAMSLGFPIIVDTSIELGHVKDVVLTREMFHMQHAQAGERPTFVVIPVKDKLELTQSLVEQLREQGGYDGIFIFDNGSGPATKEWLKAQPDLLTWDAKGVGIHHMWNAGAREAMRRSGACSDIIFLNNDLVLGHDFCQGMKDALAGQWVAVSANYDGRPGDGEVHQVHGICAERYDGTGGLAGFAFAVKSEWFAAGYAFPTDAKWWYGDNDMTLTMDMMGAPYGVATGVAVEHLGAGTAGDWMDKKYAAQLAADRAAFAAKWEQYGVKVA